MPRPPADTDSRADFPTDLMLVQAVMQGKPNAVEAFGQRLLMIPRILRAINRRRGGYLNDADLEDLAQDAFLVAWNKLDQFKGPGTLAPWIYRICQFRFLTHRRNLGRAASRTATDGQARLESVPEPESQDPDSRVEQIGLRLSALDADTQEIIRMKHFEGMSFEAIALGREQSIGRIKSRYYRGLESMRRSMGEESKTSRDCQGKESDE